MGSFLSQPLKVVCRDMEEIRAFLRTCRYVSDQEQFGVRDHWAAPEQFEQTRRGDCDDYALWTWRQILGLGYSARFVSGRAGRYGTGHAWVTFRDGDRAFIVEPQRAWRPKFPRLLTLRYKPSISVEIVDSQVKFFEHSKPQGEPPFRVVAPLAGELLVYELRLWSSWLLWPYYALRRRFRRAGRMDRIGR